MLASKFFDDVYYNNAYYARVGGISNIEARAAPDPRCAARSLFTMSPVLGLERDPRAP